MHRAYLRDTEVSEYYAAQTCRAPNEEYLGLKTSRALAHVYEVRSWEHGQNEMVLGYRHVLA